MLPWLLSELPEPAAEPTVWENFWLAQPGPRGGLLRRLRHEGLAQPLRAREVLEAIPEEGVHRHYRARPALTTV